MSGQMDVADSSDINCDQIKGSHTRHTDKNASQDDQGVKVAQEVQNKPVSVENVDDITKLTDKNPAQLNDTRTDQRRQDKRGDTPPEKHDTAADTKDANNSTQKVSDADKTQEGKGNVPISPRVVSENEKNLQKSKSAENDDKIKESQISVKITERQTQPVVGDGKKDDEDVDFGTDRESSFLEAVKKEARKTEPSYKPNSSKSQMRKKMKKGIFVTYSPDAGFLERKFVIELVKQLKENNLAEDIWFDRDENNTDSPNWFSLRMEAVERCRAAIMILSDSYFSCPVSVYEGKVLLDRYITEPKSINIFPVVYNRSEETEIPKGFRNLLHNVPDLTRPEHAKKSLAEKTSVVVGALMMEVERYAVAHSIPAPSSPPDTEFTGEYRKKKICQWTAADLQEWLFKLGIKEFYRQSFAENMVDGFLLMSMTDQDMVLHLGIDSRVVRKKVMQQILLTLDREHKLPEYWHLRARTQRLKLCCAYLVYDPADVRLAQTMKQDMVKKGIQVFHHQNLGQTKEEFLQNGSIQMAQSAFVLVILTESATESPFVFHEALFADWLGKKLVTLVFKNTWGKMRYALKAVLGDYPAVDFETKMYNESMDILEHHVKPHRTVPGVVLEQAYLNKMADGLKPLAQLSSNSVSSTWNQDEPCPRVFISYQWDTQSRVEDIRRHLEASGLPCWADISPSSLTLQRGNSSISIRSGNSTDREPVSETLQSQIQRSMKAASVVICCITPKYMQSDNCVKDLTLAETLHKPIIPVMLRFCPWPPEGAPPQVRKILVRHSYAPLDLSNDKLYKQNIDVLIERVKKMIS